MRALVQLPCPTALIATLLATCAALSLCCCDGDVDASAPDAGAPGDAGVASDPPDGGALVDADAGADAGEESVDGGGGGDEDRSALSIERDRIMSCDAWAPLGEDQRVVFLLITHLLSQSALLVVDGEAPGDAAPGGAEPEPAASDTSALAHVVGVHAIRGQKMEDCVRCCGDREFNRIYLSVDDTLAASLRANALAGWRDSRDVAGPHDPFTQSLETEAGQPRGQAHFFAAAADAVALGRAGVELVLDANALEIDLDFNVLHESGPLCTYGGETGVERYESSRGDAELAYAPPGCQ